MATIDVVLTEIKYIKNSIQDLKETIKYYEFQVTENSQHRNRQQVVNKIVFSIGGVVLGAIGTISVILVTRLL